MLAQAIAQLQQQGAGQFEGVMPPAPVVDPNNLGATRPTAQPEPSGAFASIPTNAYYGAVAARSQDPYFGGGHLAGLKMAANEGQEAYADQLARAQEETAIANNRAGTTEMVGKTLDNAADDANAGIAGAGDIFGILNQDTITNKQVNDQNTTDAKNFETIATGTEKLNQAGVQVGLNSLVDLLTPTFAEQGIDLKSLLDQSGKTPAEQVDWLKAQAAMLSAQANMKRSDAAMINANKPPAARGSKSADDDDSDARGTGLVTFPSNIRIGQ